MIRSFIFLLLLFLLTDRVHNAQSLFDDGGFKTIDKAAKGAQNIGQEFGSRTQKNAECIADNSKCSKEDLNKPRSDGRIQVPDQSQKKKKKKHPSEESLAEAKRRDMQQRKEINERNKTRREEWEKEHNASFYG